MDLKKLLTEVLERFGAIKNSKVSLEVDELKDYPTDGSITYNLSITYNNNAIYRRHFVKGKNRNIDGEQMLCEIVIEDIMHYGLDRIEKDFNKINNE